LNEQGLIVTNDKSDTNIVELSLIDEEYVTFNALTAYYTNQRWFVNGTEDTDMTGERSYTFSSVGKDPDKNYTVGLFVDVYGIPHYAEFTVKVIGSDNGDGN
jgi:hypothetical protein